MGSTAGWDNLAKNCMKTAKSQFWGKIEGGFGGGGGGGYSPTMQDPVTSHPTRGNPVKPRFTILQCTNAFLSPYAFHIFPYTMQHLLFNKSNLRGHSHLVFSQQAAIP